jgi:hypothetical protein
VTAAKRKVKLKVKATPRKTKKKKPVRTSALDRLRRICVEFPEFHEVKAWGEPTFRVKNKLFAMYADAGNHHTEGRASVWIKASAANQQLMIRAMPEKFFAPPYVGPSGWIGVYVDKDVDWDEIRALLEDGYRMVAPKRVLAAFDAQSQ